MTVGELIQELSNYDADLEVMTDAIDLDSDKLMAVVFVYPDEFYDNVMNIKKVVCLETEVGKLTNEIQYQDNHVKFFKQLGEFGAWENRVSTKRK